MKLQCFEVLKTAEWTGLAQGLPHVAGFKELGYQCFILFELI